MVTNTFQRVLLTGAAGKVGRRVREVLAQRCHLRSTDIRELDDSCDDEIVTCDLADARAVAAIARGVDAIVHLAAIPRDADINEIARANLIGTWNVFDAAKDQGVRRIVFASSNHATGFYAPSERLDVSAQPRPDGIYGASKVFGEGVARLFWDKHGIECACLRIGSVLERPTEPRHLSTWISPRDLNRLIWCALSTPAVGFTVAYGMSNNARAWWNNSGSSIQSYCPEDRSEDYAKELLPGTVHGTFDELAGRFQGGAWAEAGFTNARR